MIFPTIMFWVWMAAQQPVTPQCYGIRADNRPGLIPCSISTPVCPEGHICYPATAPAEHVIEIRTKREKPTKFQVCWPSHGVYGTSCNTYDIAIFGQPKDSEQCKAGAICTIVPRVTREIWIDGVKWGVLRESSR